MSYLCPVCDYAMQDSPDPALFNICPCCGTEFGYDDFFLTHAEIRALWLRNGSRWWKDAPVSLAIKTT